jgi:selenide,water dikinase
VDDPYAFGQIAAANALSDIYAMGGRPICALNIVGYPDTVLPIDLLGEILRGGAERVGKAGAVIGGGHSVRDAEIKYGLSVTGVIHPDRMMTNGRARPGDVLVLTKPIGSGVLTSAAKSKKITEADLAEAIDVMSDLNAGACEAMLEVGANAATDITGFGLVGHAHELAEASGLTVEMVAQEVPLLERTLELARQGVLTRTSKSNREHVGGRFEVRGVDETLVGVLSDAQTSGGLLIAVPADRTDRLVAALKQRDTRASAVIGRLTARSEHSVILT